jgi:hypothetical protein
MFIQGRSLKIKSRHLYLLLNFELPRSRPKFSNCKIILSLKLMMLNNNLDIMEIVTACPPLAKVRTEFYLIFLLTENKSRIATLDPSAACLLTTRLLPYLRKTNNFRVSSRRQQRRSTKTSLACSRLMDCPKLSQIRLFPLVP